MAPHPPVLLILLGGLLGLVPRLSEVRLEPDIVLVLGPCRANPRRHGASFRDRDLLVFATAVVILLTIVVRAPRCRWCLLLAVAVTGLQVEMHPVLGRLGLRNGDEQQREVRGFKEGLGVTRLVVVGQRGVEHLSPEPAQAVGIGAVDRHMSH